MFDIAGRVSIAPCIDCADFPSFLSNSLLTNPLYCSDRRTCGGGYTYREPTVYKKQDYGGKGCPTREEQTCGYGDCAVDCYVGDWDDWSSCSVKCGDGVSGRVCRWVIVCLCGVGRMGGQVCGRAGAILSGGWSGCGWGWAVNG